MFMFRKPGEDTSSDDDSDNQHQETTEEDDSTSASRDLDTLSRINTLGSTASEVQTPSADRPRPLRNSSSKAYIQNLLLHSLLEEKTLEDAAKHLGKTDLKDPQVQALAAAAFQSISRQLSGSDGEKYSADDMRIHRAAAQEHLRAATQNHFTTLETHESDNGPSRALVSRNQSFNILPSLDSILGGLPNPVPVPLPYPDLGLRTDRYIEEFLELGVVGKGGYGKVFKVKHKLDNSLYAVKRIMVSPARLQKIQENGPREMDSMLEEVRALAGFDHHNIVRYYNCWLEFSTTPTDVPVPPGPFVREGRLLEDASFDDEMDGAHAQLDSLSIGDPFQRSDPGAGADIVFEYSDTGGGGDDAQSDSYSNALNGSSRNVSGRNRRASQASQMTVATISSTRSQMSAIPSVEDEDEEVEIIPRSHSPHDQASTSDLSQSLLSHSDVPNHLVSTRPSGPVLTLNVQMSLYDTNLADFLSVEPSPHQTNHLRHCFHPCISLQLLSSIIAGVEYLHDNKVVHRDLKPANVFLALSTSRNPPVGSIDLSSCGPCVGRDCIHVTPRIGDFGLVAALGENCMTSNATAKPVGTQFYRPEASCKISEKLDVFALGVVGFEMLQHFSTRMERYDALTRLRRGELPPDFADRLSVSSDAATAERVQNLLSHMLNVDEEKRWGCEAVQCEMRDILHAAHK
ncbi:kinase-like protein [Aaosphaeria arxii CBS 175.79]|uniref:Kinase-like protein n=1 Tax=Aaosphaeria arxii CBS 175.79 TaxID=1450172 RepID=A0A6A5Y0Q8_9PLEO|nr:kinase-like protein [Aaosphaeria arxii CBS 175.79]KAF2018849.1 kinase-like protein [Aaosphaeria arxii CBS 175.79]